VHADGLAFIRRQLGGPGHVNGYLHSIGVDAMGIDLAPEFDDHATPAHPGARFRVGSMTALYVPDRSVAGLLAGTP